MKHALHTFLTVDGVMQSPADLAEDTRSGFDCGGWMDPHLDDVFARIITAWFSQADEILFGRSTYDAMHGVWPRVTDPDNRVAAALNGLLKHVVSTAWPAPARHNSTVISSGVIGAVSAPKDRPGRELNRCEGLGVGFRQMRCRGASFSSLRGK